MWWKWPSHCSPGVFFRHLPLALGSTMLVCRREICFQAPGECGVDVANGESYCVFRGPLLSACATGLLHEKNNCRADSLDAPAPAAR